MKTKPIITTIAVLVLIIFSCKKDPTTPSGNKIEIGQTITDTVSYFTAKVSSTVNDLGGNELSQHGHCWSKDKEPTIASRKTELGKLEAPGLFSSELAGLEDHTTYYVRSYLKYSNGVVYGDEQTLKTLKTGVPLVLTTEVENITLYTAQCGGEAKADSGLIIIAKGVCWDTTALFSVVNCIGKTNEGDSLGAFLSELSGLKEGESYFVKAYATNAKGTGYGPVKQFATTAVLMPEVVTKDISDITISSAMGGGDVTSDGQGIVSARGIVWSRNEIPTLDDNDGYSTDGSGTGSFVSSLTNLQDGTIYFVRSYAFNEKGTAYGEQKSFQTVGIGFPTLTTNNVTNVTESTAVCGGNISSAGNGSVIVRGICWNLIGTPTLDNNINFTTDGTGIGTFSSSLTGLIEATQYYVVAYATNETGTAYGEVKSLTTVDINAPAVTTASASNITTTSATAGGNVIDGGGLDVTQRGVCWNALGNPTIENNIGQTTDGIGTGSFVSTLNGLESGTVYYYRAYAVNIEGAGYGEVKQFTTTGISLPNVTTNTVTHILQTSAITGGNVVGDGNSDVTAKGVCWSTTANPTISDNHTTNGAGTGTFISNLTGLASNTTYYVRAYATNSVGTAYGAEVNFVTLSDIILPTVITDEATDITQMTATSGGNVTSDGGAQVTVRGICWSTGNNPTTSDNYTTDGSGTGNFASYLTGLSESNTYYVRAYATNSVGTSYGNEVSFTTLAPPWQCGDQITYEGQVYNTVEIGTQCWFKENLNVGVRIDGSQEQTDNGQVEKYCHGDDEANCGTYGGLYQWDEMMQYTTTTRVPDICPEGWHVPSDVEYSTLADFLGGRNIAGGKMKESGTSHWEYPNTGATNSSGFSGLPGGYSFGAFYSVLYQGAYIWTSTEYSSSEAYNQHLSYNITDLSHGTGGKEYGHSVRCLKD